MVFIAPQPSFAGLENIVNQMVRSLRFRSGS